MGGSYCTCRERANTSLCIWYTYHSYTLDSQAYTAHSWGHRGSTYSCISSRLHCCTPHSDCLFSNSDRTCWESNHPHRRCIYLHSLFPGNGARFWRIRRWSWEGIHPHRWCNHPHHCTSCMNDDSSHNTSSTLDGNHPYKLHSNHPFHSGSWGYGRRLPQLWMGTYTRSSLWESTPCSPWWCTYVGFYRRRRDSGNMRIYVFDRCTLVLRAGKHSHLIGNTSTCTVCTHRIYYTSHSTYPPSRIPPQTPHTHLHTPHICCPSTSHNEDPSWSIVLEWGYSQGSTSSIHHLMNSLHNSPQNRNYSPADRGRNIWNSPSSSIWGSLWFYRFDASYHRYKVTRNHSRVCLCRCSLVGFSCRCASHPCSTIRRTFSIFGCRQSHPNIHSNIGHQLCIWCCWDGTQNHTPHNIGHYRWCSWLIFPNTLHCSMSIHWCIDHTH